MALPQSTRSGQTNRKITDTNVPPGLGALKSAQFEGFLPRYRVSLLGDELHSTARATPDSSENGAYSPARKSSGPSCGQGVAK